MKSTITRSIRSFGVFSESQGAGVALLTTSLFIVALSLAACGGDGPSASTELRCGDGISGMLTAGGSVTVATGPALDLAGAGISANNKTTLPASAVEISCADSDIVPDGYIALGPAVTFGPAGTWSDRDFELTLPFKLARLPEGAGVRHVRIVARRHVGDGTSFFPPVSDRMIDEADPFASLVRFKAGELTTYQVVADASAGTPVSQRFTYRAIIGVSMGGNAAVSIGLRNHDRFDLIGDLGGEPGPSMKYSMTYIRDYLFGGFCTAADEAAGNGAVGTMCPAQQRKPLLDQFERSSDFEHMLYEKGDGVGLTLNRDLYMKASRDLSRAFGNPALYNPDDPYAPPGVSADFFRVEVADRCANPTVLADFYDREFNPDGTRSVITFCDGGDSPTMGLGVFDPSLAQQNPAEILLAVDLNNNGVRDPGEPVITDPFEPFDDVGADGLANADEPGYDAATNPDPNGDDFHFQRNPRGTEGNWDWDEGEPYDDFGLDGIAGTCQAGAVPPQGVADCYDFGEGDGKWTLSPNLERWFQSDLGELYANMTKEQRDRIHLWMDAGVRDFLTAHISSNVGAGIIMGEYGLPGAVWNEFESLQGIARGGRFDFAKIDWTRMPPNNYVRYGDPDASETKIENGDGRHVGTAGQLINRVTTSFAWIDANWPNGDRESIAKAGQILDEQVFTAPTSGRETPYALFLPPGYDSPENAAQTYPVVYFLHGYGQDPNDLVLVSAVFENYMTNPDWAPEERFQKFIIVYVDGRCRPNEDGVPVVQGGDLCERGTFYMDAPMDTPAKMETNMLELMDHIDANYRTKAPEMVEIVR